MNIHRNVLQQIIHIYMDQSLQSGKCDWFKFKEVSEVGDKGTVIKEEPLM